ncbi:MAG: hypothetical protein S4CHLAM45_13050 [Chlamydiales bacterium]|nr:hypothetical protein [Chlamydiales bacterium]MCH9619794.1 hypothetical protein [Chlamydiales bacterium]MCH9623400.1 hypothetical protein [Chlamydiales bacterium]
MHFTREPTIETIVTAKEGHKLVLRSSKSSGADEFFVDMVEVISFNGSCFYRSYDKPKSFILPASDYDIVEVREARMVLKSASVEKEIKIAGGKEGKKEESGEKKKRRPRKRKESTAAEKKPAVEKKETTPEEEPSLIPPPTTLISDTIARYKEMSAIEELALENAPEKEEAENDQVLP